MHKFEPRSAVGYDGGVVFALAALVQLARRVNAGRPDQLTDHHALRTVDDKAAVVRHQREIAHKDLLVHNFPRVVSNQPDLDFERRRIGGVPFAALVFAVLAFEIQRVLQKLQLESSRIIHYGREVVEYLSDALAHKSVVGIFLHLYQVGQVEHFLDSGKGFAFRIAESLSPNVPHLSTSKKNFGNFSKYVALNTVLV